MLDDMLKLYAFNLHYCRGLSADIAEEDMTRQPAAGVHTPLWILGHLAISTDFAAQCLRLPKACPVAWHKTFGPGSPPTPETPPFPTKAELLAAIEAGHARVTEAVARADADALARPHKVEFEVLKRFLPSVGDLLRHLMATHYAAHLGQLSYWRRMTGKPALF